MDKPVSLLDELRNQYEAARQSTGPHAEVEGFQAIDARMRKAFRWLEKAVTYLSGLRPPVNHRFDLGHGLVFDAPRFSRGSVGQHEHRIVGFPVLDEINVYYDISASKPVSLEVASGMVSAAEKALDDAGLQYTSRRVESADGNVHKCSFTVPPAIPARVAFNIDYQTGVVAVALVNVDRFDRVTLEFHSKDIEEPVLEDLVRLILGKDSAFLRRAPLAGMRRSSPGAP
jgi:hypothetical protein